MRIHTMTHVVPIFNRLHKGLTDIHKLTYNGFNLSFVLSRQARKCCHNCSERRNGHEDIGERKEDRRATSGAGAKEDLRGSLFYVSL